MRSADWAKLGQQLVSEARAGQIDRARVLELYGQVAGTPAQERSGRFARIYTLIRNSAPNEGITARELVRLSESSGTTSAYKILRQMERHGYLERERRVYRRTKLKLPLEYQDWVQRHGSPNQNKPQGEDAGSKKTPKEGRKKTG